ncbi:hypothetical protein SHI21_01390 [Bacteriovorax sp. PP10]|uniref:Uncharacterized protein n=1 Tax=Bacteriovorax antarcticus TaxID=3088717 RepID=A0ABU5VP63_9BACT|nr:hypothetical protein [Bacteriovorax sp. PP10]MEA9354836.1 hypothetical protein [Bacteriovorax sp. PP10]
MKLNKKMMAINVLATLLMTDVAMARISGERKPSTPGESSSSGGRSQSQPSKVKVTVASKDNFQVVKTADMVNCTMDMDQEKYFPLDLFTQLSRDEGAGVDIQLRAGNKVVVKIPPTINVCGQFTPELRQDNDTKNVTVLIKLIGTKKETIEVNGVKTVVETKDALLTHKDLEDCLVEKNIIVDGKIDYDKVPGKGYSESISTFDYDFDKKKDVKNTVTVSYGYPKSYDSDEGYKALFGFEDRTPNVPGESCMRTEKIADNSVYINEGRDVLIERINAACMSEDAQKIADAKRSMGNADALKDIAEKIKSEMDAAYLVAVKKDVLAISNKMSKIEDNLNKNKDSMDEAKAKKLMAEYASLAKDLDRDFLNPAIKRLDNLMLKRAALDDDESPAARDLDAEIKKINEDVSQFSKRNPTSFASVYSVMEKYALNDSAKTIEDIRLKSYLYGKVYAGPTDDRRGKPLSFESANQQQVQKLSSFEKTLNVWSDVYLVGKGNMLPIQRTERERQGAIDRMNSRYAAFEKKELSDYNNYCSVGMLGSVKNPVKCKEFVGGRDKRMQNELKKREKDLLYVRSKNDMLTKMGTSYNDYQRNVASKEAAEAEMYDPTGSTYTNYDDNFADRFPGYYGPSSTTAYDPNMYNMGGVSGSMNMGQPQMMMAQQQQYGGQQGYQYQMQQPQGGGQQMGAWPSL